MQRIIPLVQCPEGNLIYKNRKKCTNKGTTANNDQENNCTQTCRSLLEQTRPAKRKKNRVPHAILRKGGDWNKPSKWMKTKNITATKAQKQRREKSILT